MRVEIVKPVAYGGAVVRGGTLEVSDEIAQHWIAAGAAKTVNPPAPAPVVAAKSGEKRF